MKLNILTPLFAFLLFCTACTNDKEELLYPPKQDVCSTLNATFTNVKAIITSKCSTARCHSTATAAGRTALETYEQMTAKADRIKQRAIIDKTMPRSAPLSTDEIAIVQCWLDAGMPNN